MLLWVGFAARVRICSRMGCGLRLGGQA